MYIHTPTQTCLTEQGIRGQYPNTSFTDPFVPPEDYAYVFPAPPPEYNPDTHTVQEVQPALTTKGHWEQRWVLIELPESALLEQAAARKAGVIAQIAQLEAANLMPRPVRVALLSILPADSLEHTKVLAMEEEIQRLRVTLKEYDANTTIKQAD